MKIYIACHSLQLAKDISIELLSLGHEIASSWIYTSEFLPTEKYSIERRAEIAQINADDVMASDALVLIAGPDKYTGGKFVEMGIALGRRKRVFVLGRRENMQCWHPAIVQISNCAEIV